MTPPLVKSTELLTAALMVRLPALLAASAVPFWLLMLSVLNVVVPVSVCRFTPGAPVAEVTCTALRFALPAELMILRAEAADAFSLEIFSVPVTFTVPAELLTDRPIPCR